jgi:hypothetical protein
VNVASGGRGDAGEFATRINTAADLIAADTPTAQAIDELAERFGVSPRQARRYLDRAKTTGPVQIPEPTVVFTVKLPGLLTAEVRRRAQQAQTTISGLVTEALTGYLRRDDRGPGRR